jgi:hypothetical protein
MSYVTRECLCQHHHVAFKSSSQSGGLQTVAQQDELQQQDERKVGHVREAAQGELSGSDI